MSTSASPKLTPATSTTDQDSVDAFVADIAERYGRLDVLVNAAGRLDEADTVRFSELDTAAASALLQLM